MECKGIYDRPFEELESIIDDYINGLSIRKLSRKYGLAEKDLKRDLVFELSEGYGRKIIHNDLEKLNALISKFYDLAMNGDVKSGTLLTRFLELRQSISGGRNVVDSMDARFFFKKYNSLMREKY